MAPFDVNRVCWRVVHDEEFYRRAQANPESAIADAGLTDEERRLLLAGDVAALYERGVSGFLMEHLANWRVFGIDHENYSDRIRRAQWVPSW